MQSHRIRSEHAFLAIIAIAILGMLLLVPVLSQSMWWDEAVYLGLAQGLRAGHYSLDGSQLEAFRPPLFPALIAPFAASPDLARLIAVLLGAAALGVLWRAGDARFGKPAGALAAFFLAVSYPFLFFGTKILAETTLLLLLSLALLAFTRWEQRRMPALLACAGLFLGLAFLARYIAIVAIVPFAFLVLADALRRRTVRPLLLFSAAFALPLLPWLIASAQAYGSPLGAFLFNYSLYAASSNPAIASAGLLDLVAVWGIATPFMILGLVRRAQSPKPRTTRSVMASPRIDMLLTLGIGLSLLAYFTVFSISQREPRYLLSFFPFIALLAARGAAPLLRHRALLALLLLAGIASLSIGLQAAWSQQGAGAAPIQAAHALARLTAPGDAIITQSYPYLSVFAPFRPAVSLCAAALADRCRSELLDGTWDPSQLAVLRARTGARWLLYYKYEPTTPPTLIPLIESAGWVKRAAFAQWGDPEAAVVYEYIVTPMK